MVYYHEKLDVNKTPLSNLRFNTIITEETAVAAGENIVKGTVTIIEPVKLNGDKLALMDMDKEGNIDYLTDERVENIRKSALMGMKIQISSLHKS